MSSALGTGSGGVPKTTLTLEVEAVARPECFEATSQQLQKPMYVRLLLSPSAARALADVAGVSNSGGGGSGSDTNSSSGTTARVVSLAVSAAAAAGDVTAVGAYPAAGSTLAPKLGDSEYGGALTWGVLPSWGNRMRYALTLEGVQAVNDVCAQVNTVCVFLHVRASSSSSRCPKMTSVLKIIRLTECHA
jgi:hypothetical protein